jgi:hypothetical protein
MELIKDYDLGINYHPGKANVVADTLSRRSHVSQLVVDCMPFELCEEFDKLNLRIIANTEAMEMEVGSSLLQEIWRGQLEDKKVQEIKRNIKEEKSPSFSKDDEGVLWYKGRICVPNVKELKDKILCEAHESGYSIHLGGNKMYQDLKDTYGCYGMKTLSRFWKHLGGNKIFLTKSTLSRFWKHQRGLLKIRRSGCARCNGVTTPRKKLLRKEKKN